MNISFFYVDEINGTNIAKELELRGHNILYNEIGYETQLAIAVCLYSTKNMMNYIEKHNIKVKTASVVLDIPFWRIGIPRWDEIYNDYKKLVSKCDYIFTISNFTTSEVKRIWGLDSIPLFLEFNNKRIEEYYNYVANRKHQIVCISRFVPHKRFELVLEAIKDTDWKIVLIGYGESLNRYVSLIYNYKIDNEILINPPWKTVVEKLCESEICVHPSIFEGKSYVPKEALWCNTPVILADIPVNREFHGDSVSYFKMDDVEDLKRALDTLNRVPAISGRKFIEKNTIERVTDDIEKWLEENIK